MHKSSGTGETKTADINWDIIINYNMVSFVEKQVDKEVKVLTNDGRIFIGTLKSFD
jgi:hypothetical protein